MLRTHPSTLYPCTMHEGNAQIRLTRGQDLTWFTADGCTGPDHQRASVQACCTSICLGAGIQPCCSGLQVQGTANSPSGATNVLYMNEREFASLFYQQHHAGRLVKKNTINSIVSIAIANEKKVRSSFRLRTEASMEVSIG